MPVWGWIALGSGVGGALRFAIDSLSHTVLVPTLPWPTLLINLSGCLLIGWLAAVFSAKDARRHLPVWLRHFLMIGFCGGFTTFSMLSIESLALLQEDLRLGVGNLVITVIGCVAAVAVGHRLGLRKASRQSSSPEKQR